MKKSLALLASCLISVPALAEVPFDFALSAQPTMTRIKAAGEHFSPTLLQFKADAVIDTGPLSGVGFQAVVGAPLGKDNADDLSIELTQHTAAYITFMNPNLAPDDLRLVAYIGYASTGIETYVKSRDYADKDTYSGTSYGFSLQQRVVSRIPVYLTLDCARYYNKSSMRVDGCGIGATYAF